MENKGIRKLHANEIECRVGTCGESKDKSKGWCTLLLYKDARVDQRLLDEVYGSMNWQREHILIDGQLFCTVSIWDEDKKQWVKKQDVGTESMTEKEKGRASDAFKRACFNIGIGRELYTAPSIYVSLTKEEYNNGRIKPKFECKEIGYDAEGCINRLVIVDNNGSVRYKSGNPAANTPTNTPVVNQEPTTQKTAAMLNDKIPVEPVGLDMNKVNKWVEGAKQCTTKKQVADYMSTLDTTSPEYTEARKQVMEIYKSLLK